MTHNKPEPHASSLSGTSDADLDLLFGDPDARSTGRDDARPVDSSCVIHWDWETDYGF